MRRMPTAALANAIMLLVTYWFHVTHPYGDAFLTPAGIEYLTQNTDLLTSAGQRQLLPDGGARFLTGPTGVLKPDDWFSGWAGALSVDRFLRKADHGAALGAAPPAVARKFRLAFTDRGRGARPGVENGCWAGSTERVQ